jgi:UDP-N-acetylglucosamine diphosphorylase/glucosamine-1-phosphate N-acetyltransferase
MTICLFEDKNYRQLLPLCYARPVYELKVGAFTLLERILDQYPKTKFSLHCRPHLVATLKQRYGDLSINKLKKDSYLFLNGRILGDGKLPNKIKVSGPNCSYWQGRDLIAVRLDQIAVAQLDLKKDLEQQLKKLPRRKVVVKKIDYLWDLIRYHEELLAGDINGLLKGKSLATKYREGVFILNSKKIFIDRNCDIKPGVVLDASGGPIYIEEGVTIGANSVLTGPVYIGYDSVINPLARINHNTYIGPVCKIGGEVGESIIQSFSNKQHDGHLGHSYIGSWCNLGAGTTNSDMKNNYGAAKVWINGQMKDSRMTFLGLFMADHSKSGISTQFNTGTVVGFSTNVFGSKLTPKAIPSYGWVNLDGKSDEYNLSKAIAAASIAMKRRKQKMTPAIRKMFKDIYKESETERKLLLSQINKK